MKNIVIKTLTPETLEEMLRAEQRDRAEYALTPADLEPLVRYVDQRIEPGGFLMAVLTNDLKDALGRADQRNRRRIFEYAEWLYNRAPSACWGSPEKVHKWLSNRDDKKGPNDAA